jgi:hypothetical protein
MRAIKRKNMRLIGKARNAPRASILLSIFLGLALLLACSSGCAPAKQNSSDSASGDVPELTEEMIKERINETRVWEVPEENGAGEPITWNFDEDEPKEIAVVEKKMDGDRATIVLEIKTRSATYVRNPRSLAGQIRTDWELKTGWALRRWEIVETENISMKYKNIPKPPEQNSNR